MGPFDDDFKVSKRQKLWSIFILGYGLGVITVTLIAGLLA